MSKELEVVDPQPWGSLVPVSVCSGLPPILLPIHHYKQVYFFGTRPLIDLYEILELTEIPCISTASLPGRPPKPQPGLACRFLASQRRATAL